MRQGKAGRNRRLAFALTGIVAGMVALAFASVPLYRLFCQATGFGGTTRVASAPAAETRERLVTVRFNAEVDPKLPWSFRPEVREVTLKVGESGLVFFHARNLAARTTHGTATFNVTPAKVGPYFNKVQCFCFEQQELKAGESVEMGVSFFLDPRIVEDPGLEEVRSVTLSYTFFRSLEEAAGEREVSALAVPDGIGRDASGVKQP